MVYPVIFELWKWHSEMKKERRAEAPDESLVPACS
jgi:hypothetical protein